MNEILFLIEEVKRNESLFKKRILNNEKHIFLKEEAFHSIDITNSNNVTYAFRETSNLDELKKYVNLFSVDLFDYEEFSTNFYTATRNKEGRYMQENVLRRDFRKSNKKYNFDLFNDKVIISIQNLYSVAEYFVSNFDVCYVKVTAYLHLINQKQTKSNAHIIIAVNYNIEEIF